MKGFAFRVRADRGCRRAGGSARARETRSVVCVSLEGVHSGIYGVEVENECMRHKGVVSVTGDNR